MSVITRVRREGTAEEITFEEENGFEVFTYQIMSLNPNDNEDPPLLLDFAGRVVQDNDDFEDIKVTVDKPVEMKSDDQIQEEVGSLPPVPVVPSSSSDQRQLNSISASTYTIAADLWCIDNSIANVGDYCTRMFLQADQRTNTQPDTKNEGDDVLQPVYRIVDTSIHLCGRCQLFFDPSLIVDKAMEMGLASAEASECLLT